MENYVLIFLTGIRYNNKKKRKGELFAWENIILP